MSDTKNQTGARIPRPLHRVCSAAGRKTYRIEYQDPVDFNWRAWTYRKTLEDAKRLAAKLRKIYHHKGFRVLPPNH
jgi:long-subunit acyl-CoA synthetase (AMP-forming)